ncbi:orotate phosphoribosyltransferase [uncultured bacterium]|nr:orotate phosphoribosyltransferase [uncultured bacterium]
MLKALIDIVFPPMCLLCGERSPEKGFCDGCGGLVEKERIRPPLCIVCGTPFPSAKGVDHACGRCVEEPPSFTSARSAFVFEGKVLEAVHKLKYGGDTALAGPLASLLSAAHLPEGLSMVVPVPLHPARLKERGFNQSLLIARELSRNYGLSLVYDRLKRARDTGQQVGLKAAERKKNVSGAFTLDGGSFFKGRKVLLVDDVTTTGATLNECAKVLKKAGAEVIAITVARAVKL